MKPQNIKRKDLLHRLAYSGFILGLVSMAWFILRTGTKPSRQTYPCQQIAKANTEIWLLAYIAPILAIGTQRKIKLNKNILVTVFICVILLATGTYYLTQKEKVLASSNNFTNVNGTIPVNLLLSTNNTKPINGENQTTPAITMSSIYVVNGTQGGDGGVRRLVELMGNSSLNFYQSPTPGKNKGPTGLIASDDTVIIKVNSQWDQRGGTNTDLLKEVIQAITEHPDGWTGEIIVADNGQAQAGSEGTGGSFEWVKANAQDHSQSVQRVVDGFDPKYRVSTYLWDKITETIVEEYYSGDNRDGYIVNATRNPRTGIMVSYPKFTTKYGAMVSFKLGVWNMTTRTYDSGHLKVINMPVLKTHGSQGVTGSVKHYMGVGSDKITNQLGARNHNLIKNGAMGTEMAQTRFPTLNILDCIWVQAMPLGGPTSSYSAAVAVNMVVAGTDPVAIDYWASKNILLRVTPDKTADDVNTMDPDYATSGSFGYWLRLSMNEMTRAGYQATVDESKMSIHLIQLNGKTSTKISALISKFDIIIGANDSIVVKLEPVVQGASVTLKLVTPKGDLRAIEITMGSDGRYIYTFTPDMGGFWEYQASWEGDTNYIGSSSDQLGFFVELHEYAHTIIKVTVVDRQGAYIVGAVVTSTAQPEGQAKLSNVTDNSGSATFFDVKPGVYSFSVSKGELTASVDSLKVEEGAQSSPHVSLYKPDSPSVFYRVPGYPEVLIILGILVFIMALLWKRGAFS